MAFLLGNVPLDLIIDMNRRAKLNLSNEQLDDPQRSILMWEDKALGDCRHLDDLDKPLDQALAELADGVVIIFQVSYSFNMSHTN